MNPQVPDPGIGNYEGLVWFILTFYVLAFALSWLGARRKR